MRLSRDQKISILLAIITIGFTFMTFFYYDRGMLAGRGFPDNTPLTPAVTQFGDFLRTIGEWHKSHFAGIGFGHSYFPALYLLVEPFSRLAFAPIWGRHGNLISLLVFEALVTGFVFFWAWDCLRSKYFTETLTRAFVFTFMTYPVMFNIITGNFEGLLFVALALFVIFYRAGHVKLSTPFLALCISMKLFPAVFCVLFLADKNYRALFQTVLWAVVFTLVPLLVFEGGLRDGVYPYLQNLQASQKMYYDFIVAGKAGNYWGHSLLNCARVLLGQTANLSPLILRWYTVFTLACFAGIAFYIVTVEKNFWKRVALLVCSMCLLPYSSNDYKLLHFYIPMFLFINWERSGKLDAFYIALFGIILIPKGYITLHHIDLYTTQVVFTTAAMLFMVGAIIWTGITERLSSRSSVTADNSSPFQTSG